MLALGIEYLTGYATATSTGDRGVAEWPPHPGRVFMAMAAAFFESRPEPSEASALARWNEEEAALRWLEGLDAPIILASQCDDRSVTEVYVKPNDFSIFDASGKPTKIPNPSAPNLTDKQRKLQVDRIKDLREIIPTLRNGKERTFPKVRPHETTLYLHWPEAKPTDTHRAALDRVCAKVIRIGHSSSLVRMWVEARPPELRTGWTPASEEHTGSLERFRMPGPGCLDYLRQQYNGEAVESFYEFYARIQATKGKPQKEAKAEFENEFGCPWKASLPPPGSRRPVLSMTQAYRSLSYGPGDEASPVPTVFDDTLLVLDKREGPNLGLETTWRLLTALRGTIEKHAAPTPEWVNGHRPDGQPSDSPHLALLPLGFVGHEHADGHLLGVALAFPRRIPPEERGKFVGKLLYDTKGLPRDLRLTLGKLGVWTLGDEQRPSPPRALRSATWTRPAEVWASVSPVVLDRHPKSDPRKDRPAYLAEVAAIVSESCGRIGLPDPVEIDIDKTSWHRGAPRAKPGPDGYPLMPQRPGGPNRRQVHVWLRFDRPVLGPVLLGAGRYRGYGLCKPWREGGAE